MTEPLIQNISDTALWVAVYRANETDRPDALFRDPFARRLAGTRGEQIAAKMGFSGRDSWPFVARTWAFDNFISEQMRAGADMVVNLAAGLDTRPYRMTLPSSLKWIEVDLPAIFDYKARILAQEKPACSLERVRLDQASRVKRTTGVVSLGRSLFVQQRVRAGIAAQSGRAKLCCSWGRAKIAGKDCRAALDWAGEDNCPYVVVPCGRVAHDRQ